ncbi:hypothetical protein GGF43_001151 [Coemansia sp. RSA 2618]|nr:hypothetical protein GGF43_001151 [Coemansia sp. RSA 2618]
MGYLNRYLLLLAFNVLNVVAFGAIVSVAVINIVDHQAPTNLIIYYAYTGLLSLSLLLSEIRAPRLLNAQARFLFTYTGRGIVLTYFGCIVYTSKLFNVIACIYTVSLGVVYFVVAWTPFVPMQHGFAHNWSHWMHEGGERQDDELDIQAAGVMEQNSDDEAGERDASLRKATRADSVYARGPVHPAHGAHASVHSIAWPAAQTDEECANDSFVYGMTTAARRAESTGDTYLDSIVNSSRFARELLDPVDELIVVRGLAAETVGCDSGKPHGDALRRSATALAMLAPSVGGSPAPRPYTAASHYRPSGGMHMQLPISSPMPYHVFAPNSRESLAENIAHVNRALDSTDAPSSPSRRILH